MSLLSNASGAKAVVDLTLNDSELKAGLERSKLSLQEFGKVAVQIGAKLSMAGVAMVAPFKQALDVFSQFDDAMRTVGAVTGAAAQEFQKLTKRAQELGAATSFSAQQVADGMASLGRMGFNSSQIDNAIDDMMNLSRATGTELSTAAEIAANNMAVFGLNANKASKVADVLALTANSSAQRLEDLGEALKMAGPFANTANQSLEQTCAALGVLANMGIRGSMAGTALAKTYKRLADPKVRDYLRNTFNVEAVDAAGNLRDVATVLGEIGKAISNLGNADQIAALEDIFDARGALAGGQLSINTEGIDQLLDKYKEVTGYAEKTAEAMDAGVGGAMRRAASAFEGMKIAVGEAVAPAMEWLLGILSSVANAITSLSESCPWLMTALAALGTATLSLGAVFGTLGLAISTTKSILDTFKTIKLVKGFSALKDFVVSGAKSIGDAFKTIFAQMKANNNVFIETYAKARQSGMSTAEAFKAAGAGANTATSSVNGLKTALQTLSMVGVLAFLTAVYMALSAYKQAMQDAADATVEGAQRMHESLSHGFNMQNRKLEAKITASGIDEDKADEERLKLMEQQMKKRQQLMADNRASINELDEGVSFWKMNKGINGEAMQKLVAENDSLQQENDNLYADMQDIRARMAKRKKDREDAKKRQKDEDWKNRTAAIHEMEGTFNEAQEFTSRYDESPLQRELRELEETRKKYIDALKEKKKFLEEKGFRQSAQIVEKNIQTVQRQFDEIIEKKRKEQFSKVLDNPMEQFQNEQARKGKPSVQKELDELERKRAAYIKAANELAATTTSKRDKAEIDSKVKAYNAMIDKAKEDAIARYNNDNSTDIDADMRATGESMRKSAIGTMRDSRLDALKQQGGNAYMAELRRLFSATSFSMQQAATVYKQMQAKAKSADSESGAVISEEEKKALDKQLEVYNGLKDRLTDLHSKLLDGAQEADREQGNMKSTNETFGSFIAAAFAGMGAKSKDEEIAHATQSTAKNTRDTLTWLKRQNFTPTFA